MDPIITGALISGGASLLGGLFGSSSAREEAQRDRRFQREMAQNSMQYRVADLQKAGLNPMLAYMGGGGSVGGAAQPHGANAANAVGKNILGDAVHSALSTYRAGAEIELMKSQASKARAEATQTSYQTQLPEVYNEAFQSTIDEVQARITNWDAKTIVEQKQKEHLEAQIRNLDAKTRVEDLDADLRDKVMNFIVAQERALAAASVNAEAFEHSAVGKAKPYVRLLRDSAGNVIDTAARRFMYRR